MSFHQSCLFVKPSLRRPLPLSQPPLQPQHFHQRRQYFRYSTPKVKFSLFSIPAPSLTTTALTLVATSGPTAAITGNPSVSTSSSSSGLSHAAIGGIVGGFASLLIIIALVLFWW